ncbi:MAG: transposase [Candidatus Acidiferrales bacterium]|jgi:transposase
MSKRRARYSAEFKQDAVSRMGQRGKTVTALAEELGVGRKFLYLWRERLQAGGKAALERGRGRPPGSKSKSVSQPAVGAAELRIAELERLLGRKQVELDFFKRTFEHVRGAAANRTSDGGKGSMAASKPRSHSKE